MTPSSLSTIQHHIQCILYTHTHTVKITMHIIRTIVVLTLILPQYQTQTLHYLFPKITSYQKVLVPLAKSSSFRTRLLLLTANREHEASKSLGIWFNIDMVDSNDNLMLIWLIHIWPSHAEMIDSYMIISCWYDWSIWWSEIRKDQVTF